MDILCSMNEKTGGRDKFARCVFAQLVELKSDRTGSCVYMYIFSHMHEDKRASSIMRVPTQIANCNQTLYLDFGS